jgi:hypothetical protein
MFYKARFIVVGRIRSGLQPSDSHLLTTQPYGLGWYKTGPSDLKPSQPELT